MNEYDGCLHDCHTVLFKRKEGGKRGNKEEVEV